MALRSTNSAVNTGTSTSVTVPAGEQANDIALLAISVDTAGALGWSTFTGLDSTALTGDGQQVGAAWKRPATADTGSYTVTHGNSDTTLLAAAFSGRDTTNPPVLVAATPNNSGNASPVTASVSAGVTAQAGDDLVFVMIPDTHASVTVNFTPPTGFTTAVTAGSPGWSAAHVSVKENVAAGATGVVSGSFTCVGTVSGWQAYLIRIPAAAGGGSAFTGSVGLGGTGSLNLAGTPAEKGTATLSGSGSLAATGTPAASGTATLSGSGGLSMAGTPATSRGASLTGSGTLTASGTAATTGSAGLSGAGTLTASGSMSGGNSYSGTANLSGSGTLSTAVKVAAAGAAALAGSGTLATTGSSRQSGTVALSGSGTLAYSAAIQAAGTALLTGSGTLTASGFNPGAIAPTPADRTTRIPAEPRRTLVAAESRVTTVPAERRVTEIR